MYRRIVLALVFALVAAVFGWAVVSAQDSGGDRVLVGETFVLAPNQQWRGDLAALRSSVRLEENSVIHGDVAAAGSNLEVAGTVAGDLAVFGGRVILRETAVIQGDLATLGASVERTPGAEVRGQTIEGLPGASFGPWLELGPGSDLPEVRVTAGPWGMVQSVLFWWLRTLAWSLLLALLGVFAVAIAPRPMSRIASAAAAEPLMSFALGLLTAVIAAIAGVLLLVACCLGVFVWIAAGVAALIGWLAVGLWVGQRILTALGNRDVPSLVEIALGVFLVSLLAVLPWCIGFIITVVFGCIGLGAVVMTRFGTRPVGRGSALAVSDVTSWEDAQLQDQSGTEAAQPQIPPQLPPD